MIPSALSGLGGLSVASDGTCTLDVNASGSREATPLAMAAFLAALASPARDERVAPRNFDLRRGVAKAQLAGPATVMAFTRTSTGSRAAQVPRLVERVIEHLAAKAASMARAMSAAQVTPMIVFDEPGLGLGELPLAALERVRKAASDAGAITGLHCCGQARWAELLGLGFDVISIDARHSLDALLEDRRAWLGFLERGGTLCLGIIPTNLGARYSVDELCDSVEASLRATTPQFEKVLARMSLSPACGLALHSVEGAARISAEVRAAQVRLRALL